jgi:hypothetical protein
MGMASSAACAQRRGYRSCHVLMSAAALSRLCCSHRAFTSDSKSKLLTGYSTSQQTAPYLLSPGCHFPKGTAPSGPAARQQGGVSMQAHRTQEARGELADASVPQGLRRNVQVKQQLFCHSLRHGQGKWNGPRVGLHLATSRRVAEVGCTLALLPANGAQQQSDTLSGQPSATGGVAGWKC